MKSACATPTREYKEKTISEWPVKSTTVVTEDLMHEILRVIACIKDYARKVDEIKKLAFSPKGKLITFWFFTDTHEPAVLKKIYQFEQKVRETFPHMLFDFTVIFDSKENAPVNFITEYK